jgi:hypothetical protein
MGIHASTIGLIVGLVIGYFWIVYSPGTALLLGLFGFIGWLIGKLVTGEVNIEAIRQIFVRR